MIKLANLSILLALMASCQSMPDQNRKLVVLQCSPNLVFEQVEVMRAEGVRVEVILDMQKSECNCRRYKYSLDFMGPIAQSLVTHPIEYCQRMIGNPPDEYGKVTNFLGDIRKDIQEASRKR